MKKSKQSEVKVDSNSSDESSHQDNIGDSHDCDIETRELLDLIQNMTYEDSLNALDLILSELQNDNFKVDELQNKFMQGKAYLQRCELLLNTIEQQIIQLEPESIKTD